MRTFAKRAAAVAATAALTVAGLAATTAPAQAAGPGGSTNIRGTQPGDTDDLMDRLCSQKTSLTGVYGAYNVKTGEFKTHDEYLEIVRLFMPVGDWETFRGWCAFPEASTWTHKGQPVRVARPQRNSGSTADSAWFTVNYTTKETTKKSVGAELSLSAAKGLFSGSAGGSFSYEWSWESSESVEYRRDYTIPACTEVWLEAIPHQRTVRVNPVFYVQEYSWNKGSSHSDEVTVDTWRGKGDGWKTIYSYGNYIDGTADVLLDSDGKPDYTLDKKERKLDPSECA